MKTSTRTVLTEFLAATAPDRAHRTRQRDTAIAADLVEFLDGLDLSEATRFLGTGPAELFALERAFDGPAGAGGPTISGPYHRWPNPTPA